MEDYDIKRSLTRREAKIFGEFFAEYNTNYKNFSADEMKILLDQKTIEHLNYENLTKPTYKAYEKGMTASVVSWFGVMVGTMAFDLVCDLSFNEFAVFGTLGAGALAGVLYCATKQKQILKNRINNCLEELAIIEVVDNKQHKTCDENDAEQDTTEPEDTSALDDFYCPIK